MPTHDFIPSKRPRMPRSYGMRDLLTGMSADELAEAEFEQAMARLREAELDAAAAVRERDRWYAAVLRADRSSKPRRKRKPPEAGLAVPAIPPRGPMPLQGGAKAPLEFDD